MKGRLDEKEIITINLIQDVATPHNNILISQFKGVKNVKIKLWYAIEQDKNLYHWRKNITHEHFQAEIYGRSFNWKFIKYCLSKKNERFVIVGWMNTNTRLIHFLFFLLRRPYNHWTDLPNSEESSITFKKKIMRWIAYTMLNKSRAKVFGVGQITLNYLRKMGFHESKLINLPILVESNEDLPKYFESREKIFKKHLIQSDDFVISSGSRIIYDKGFDLLVNAIGRLAPEIQKHIKVIIVGSGDMVNELESLINNLKLTKQIILEKWLPIEEFKAVIANSHIFIQPARIDSYGGTVLGMALGVPVIGSYGAGAAVDRIKQGLNGFLYSAEDIDTLANLIKLLYENPNLRINMAAEAIKTAKSWPPIRGMQIIVENSI